MRSWFTSTFQVCDPTKTVLDSDDFGVHFDSDGSCSEADDDYDDSPRRARSRGTSFAFLGRLSTHVVPETRANPFENPAPWTRYEVFKLVFCGLTLFPIRLAIAAVLLLLGLVIALIASVGLPLEEDRGCYYRTELLPMWRRLLLAPLTAINRGLLWCFGFWRIHIRDHRHDRSRMPNIVVVAPHLSLVDFGMVGWTFPPLPAAVGDAQIIKAPAGRQGGAAMQGIFVNVSDKASRASCRDAIAMRANPDWKGAPLTIFPEGRITNGEMLIQFKLGAFHPGQPVLPVTLRYPHKYFNPTWVGKNRSAGKGALWALRMMTQFANHCVIDIQDVYCPNAAEAADPVLFAKGVREVMADELDLPVTEHTYDDAFLYQAAARAHVQSDFEVESMRDILDVDLAQLLDWLEKFKALDAERVGVLTREEFVEALLANSDGEESASGDDEQQRLPESLNRLFEFFDTDGSGLIEYREFVQGMALLSGRCSDETRTRLAFLVYDVEGRGRVRVEVLRQALDNAFALGGDAGCSLSDDLLSPALFPQIPGLVQELNFDQFCQLLTRQPLLLDAAFARMRRRLV
eukprot:TRINITY_DN17844_c0_g1_i1.p1 TRINITY_DN17844_c0_g1~~TRINITY_DN17844_c0_g1_i1.p1  ORF type:complete len:574 (-),score=108.74 TRINITY_DN17844_c0_g1_i1:122-1843(-)